MGKAMQAILKAITAVKPSVEESIHEQRLLEETLGALELGDTRVRVERTHTRLKDGTKIQLLVFTPRKDIVLPLKNNTKEELDGTLVFIHGGGWVAGNVELYTDSCKETAHHLNRRIISIDYPLAPEYKFPRALNVCYEVYTQLMQGHIIKEIDPDKVCLFGDSAGGNLCAALSLMARKKRKVPVHQQILLYPALSNCYDMHSPFESVHTNGTDYYLTAEDMQEYLKLYVANKKDLRSPYLAPLLADDYSDMPRTLIMSAEYCPLRDEDNAYALLLKEAGNDVMAYEILDAIHGYFTNPYAQQLVLPTVHIMKHFLNGTELKPTKKLSWQPLIDETLAAKA